MEPLLKETDLYFSSVLHEFEVKNAASSCLRANGLELDNQINQDSVEHSTYSGELVTENFVGIEGSAVLGNDDD